MLSFTEPFRGHSLPDQHDYCEKYYFLDLGIAKNVGPLNTIDEAGDTKNFCSLMLFGV